MSLRTSAEIKTKITALEAKIEIAEDKLQYSLDTGQGKQSVQRASLDSLYKALQFWEQKYEKAIAEESGSTGIISLQFQRHG